MTLQANLRSADTDVEMKRMRESEEDSEVGCLLLGHLLLSVLSFTLLHIKSIMNQV